MDTHIVILETISKQDQVKNSNKNTKIVPLH